MKLVLFNKAKETVQIWDLVNTENQENTKIL